MSSAAINHVIQKALLKNLTVKLVIGQNDQLVDIENIYAISIFQ